MIRNLVGLYKKMSLPVKASLWYMLCSILQKGISVLTTPIFTRIMTTEQYGLVTVYNSWESIVTVFATLNFTAGVYNNAMIRYEKDRDGYTSVLQTWTTIIAISLFIVYFFTRNFWNAFFELPTGLVTIMFLDIILSAAMSFWTVRNRYEFKYLSVCLVTVAASILTPVISIILVCSTQTHKGEAKIIGTVLSHLIVYGVVYVLIIVRGKKVFNREYVTYSTKFNIPLIPHYLSQNVLSQADRVMINSMCSMEKAGIYGVAYQAGFLINIVTNAINGSFVPLLYESLKEKNYKRINTMAIMIQIGVGSVCLLFSLFAPELMKILATEEYYEAIWIVPPVAMSSLFVMMYSFFTNIEFYFGKNKFIMVASIMTASLNILLNWIFISLYGYIAAGYTTLFCYFVYSLAQYMFMRHVCKKEKIDNPYNGKIIWSIAAFFLIMSLAGSALYTQTLIRYIVIVSMLIFMTIVLVKKKDLIMSIVVRRQVE